tara:strand:+ start:110 stop:421 length:312 start_codon:yes stop_codon:yes gene_type:complete
MPDSWRLIAKIWNLKYTDKVSLNISGQLWEQPALKFYSNNNFIISDGLGGLFTSTVNYDISKNKNVFGVTLEIGFKSTGYVLGEELNKGMIIRGGLLFRLGTN